MGKSKDLATGETRFVNTAGDNMTGNLGIGTTSPNGALHVKGISDHGKIVVEHGGTSGSTNHNFISFHNHAGNTVAEIQSEENATNSSALLFKTGGTTTNMKVSHNGYVTMPNQPKFRVKRTTSVNLTGNGGKQNLVFNSADFDVGSGYNTSTGKYTVPATGVYFFFLNPRFDGVASNTYVRSMIYRGASVPGSPWSDYANVLSSIDGDGHSTNYHTVNVSGIFSCVAGDTINFIGGGDSDPDIYLQAESQAGGFMIG